MRELNAAGTAPGRWSRIIPVCLVLLPLISCGWSSRQQEVLDAYILAAETLGEEDWQAALPLLTIETGEYLQVLADSCRNTGLPISGSAVHLLGILTPEYIDLSGEVTMIFLEGGSATVTVTSEVSREFTFILQNDTWKLDLSEYLLDRIQHDLEGAAPGTGVRDGSL